MEDALREAVFVAYHERSSIEQLRQDSPLEQSLFGAYYPNVPEQPQAVEPHLPSSNSWAHFISSSDVSSLTHSTLNSIEINPGLHAAEHIFPVAEARSLAENQRDLMLGLSPAPSVPVVCLANTPNRQVLVLEEASYESLFGNQCSICSRQFPRDYDEADLESARNPQRLEPVRMTTFCCGETLFCTKACVKRWLDGNTLCSACSSMLDDLRDVSPSISTIHCTPLSRLSWYSRYITEVEQDLELHFIHTHADDFSQSCDDDDYEEDFQEEAFQEEAFQEEAVQEEAFQNGWDAGVLRETSW